MFWYLSLEMDMLGLYRKQDKILSLNIICDTKLIYDSQFMYTPSLQNLLIIKH